MLKKIFILLLAYSSLQACEFEMGWMNYPPYQFEINKKIQGIDIEIVQAATKEAGCKLKLTQIPWTRALLYIKDGKLDAYAGASFTTERNIFAYFSEPVREESMVIYLNNKFKNKFKFNTLSEILEKEIKIGITRGFFYGKEFEELKESKNFEKVFLTVNLDDQNFSKLRLGRIDGLITDKYVGYDYLKKNKMEKDHYQLAVVHDNNTHVLFSKVSVEPNTVETFNKGLAKIKSNGKYEQILKQYAGE